MADRYKAGDRVFAKLKGYPPWPARVKAKLPLKVETYRIYFYGTYEEASIRTDSIFDYNEANIAKYGKELRRSRFKEAMQEIADNIEIKSGSGKELDANKDEAVLPSLTPEMDKSDTDTEGELLIDEGPSPPVLRKEVKQLIPAPTLALAGSLVTPGPPPRMTPAPYAKAAIASHTKGKAKATPVPKLTPAPTAMDEDALGVTPTSKQSRRRSRATKDVDVLSTPSAPVETTPQPEIVSRSGRKIKPNKRFADEEEPKAASKADDSKGSENATSKRNRRTGSLAPTSNTPTSSTKASGKGNTIATPQSEVPPPALAKPNAPASGPSSSRRTRQSMEPQPTTAPERKSPGPTLRAKSFPAASVPAPTTRVRTPNTRSKLPAVAVIPTGSRKTSIIAVKGKPTAQQLPNTIREDSVPGMFPNSEDEEGGGSTPRDEDLEDKENNENTLSDEEGQWMDMENGDGELEGEGEADGELSEEEEDVDGEEEEDTSDLDDDRIERELLSTKSGIVLEVTYDEDRPEEFETDRKVDEWDLANSHNAYKIRSAIQGDETVAMNFLGDIAEDIAAQRGLSFPGISRAERNKTAFRIHQLRMEGEMIEIIGEIVGCLTLTGCDCERAIELLERLATHKLNSLVLVKHPEVVHILVDLLNYEGDPVAWNYNEVQTEDLKMKSAIIREIANDIYLNIKSIFNVDPDKSLSSVFHEEVTNFRKSVVDKPYKEVIVTMVAECPELEEEMDQGQQEDDEANTNFANDELPSPEPESLSDMEMELDEGESKANETDSAAELEGTTTEGESVENSPSPPEVALEDDADN